ncbi:MAG: ATP-dependent Clp protease proteolytic subunit [Porticoccaceae bacterium]|nr:ATP-dependent Clp protease proteolytic subunit [Porticoccaceae bacterium]
MPQKQTWYSMTMAADGAADVYIYDYIGYWGVTAKDFARDLKALGTVSKINLHINSPGGDVFDGTAIYNLLKSHDAEVITHIEGLAASMGSVIALAGDTVNIAENAYYMIHNPSSIAWGDHRAMEKTKALLEKVRRTMIGLYASASGMDEDAVAQLMDDETWYVGQEAVDAGFATATTARIDLAASYSSDLIGQFKHAPQEILQIATAPPARPAASPARPILFPSAVADTHPQQEGTPMPQPTPAAPAATADPVVTPEMKATIEAELRQKETQRRTDIQSAFKGFESAHKDLLDACLQDMDCSVAAAKDKLLAALGSQTPSPGHSYAVTVQDGGGMARLRADATNAIAMRAFGEQRAEGNAVAGYTLMELARTILQARGASTGGMDKMQMVAAAFTHTSGDFGTILGNIANKAMLKGYEEAAEVFPQFTATGNLGDFKIQTRADLGAFPSLRKVAEGAEYKYVTLGERAETAVLATYGELFGITRQAIINDDLSAFTRIPGKMGRAAIRTVGDLVFSIFLNNPKMADGVDLFHATHNNLASQGGINTGTIDAARVKMATQKDGPAALNIRPAFLLCDVALEGAAKVALESEFEVGASAKSNTVPNSVRGIASVISDARLANHSAWYLLASPTIHDTIEVLYLDGQQAPVLEQQSGWNVDGVEFKVRMDAAAKAWDYRGMVKTPTGS